MFMLVEKPLILWSGLLIYDNSYWLYWYYFIVSLRLICFSFFLVVTLYATLGEEAIAYGINQADVEVVITDGHLLSKLQVIASKITKVRTIIYMGNLNQTNMAMFPKHIKVLSMNDVEAIGLRSQNSKSYKV